MRQKTLKRIQDKKNGIVQECNIVEKNPKDKNITKRKDIVNSQEYIYDKKCSLGIYKTMFNNRKTHDDEEWRDVVGYEGLYKVSNYGIVINRNYRIVGTYYADDENGFCNKKYNCISLTKDGVRKTFQIHRLVAIAFVENLNPNEFNVVNHKDENIHNNYYKNLEWCTAQYNLHYGSANKNRQRSKKELAELRKSTTNKTI